MSGCFFLMLIESPSEAQIDVDGRMGQSNAGALGGLPPELISKIQALAVLLQQKTAEGKINDRAIQQHMQSGDAAGAIRGLGPEAERLLNDIKSAFHRIQLQRRITQRSVTGADERFPGSPLAPSSSLRCSPRW